MGNVMNRVFDSSGPEGKVRGTPQQIIDKYQQLTRDAQLSGDRVAAENFKQHAEHYMRMLSEAQREAEARRVQHDRENREKQAQRDQERQERDAQREAVAVEQVVPTDPSETAQPDLVVATEDDRSTLVDTPEGESAEKPKPRRRRTPKPKPEVEAEAPLAEAAPQD